MNTTPLFSVLIPNYNNGRYLQQAIDSVCKQTYTQWEIIIVDDASTDISHEIYRKYANDSRFRIFYHTENKGCTYTKWKCITEAKGELCGFLDSDDVLLPDALMFMVDIHQQNPLVSLVFSRHYICDEQLNVVSESRLLFIAAGESYLTTRDYAPEVFASFKLSFYQKTKGLNTKNTLGDDQELYLLLEEVGAIFILDKFTYKYRKHQGSISTEKELECSYWNIIVRHEACLRRGVNPVDFPYQDFLYACTAYACLQIENNKAYRLGAFILIPFRWMKRLLRFIYRKYRISAAKGLN